jgi:SM-20-related protein
MPGPAFFKDLGLFTQQNFFDSPSCAQIREQLMSAECEKATIVGSDPARGTVDESFRKVLCASVEKSAICSVKERLEQLKPRLEEHFNLTLAGFEDPTFLIYREGAFYKPHLDASPDSPDFITKRRVSVVIFLNGGTSESVPDGYGGGSLTFYGLMKEPQWEKCAFPLQAEPGLLIGFRSDTLHEVRPVTFGQRFTIVTWYTAE